MAVIRSQCKDDAEYRIALRDDFAAAALTGLLGSPAWEKACEGQDITKVPSVSAEAAYEIADAMLAERGKA